MFWGGGAALHRLPVLDGGGCAVCHGTLLGRGAGAFCRWTLPGSGSRGFRGVGRRKNYYEHPKEDAVIMTLDLTGEEETDE